MIFFYLILQRWPKPKRRKLTEINWGLATDKTPTKTNRLILTRQVSNNRLWV